ncbi:MAG: UDP-2,3-diacylglucosamine diphosphatase [Candidatus Neomarinimicrobiota bacterium]|tara:strand:- start:2590 stop:3330 length:741 start_codon:yes stop_codon:yes gene_type:complete
MKTPVYFISDIHLKLSIDNNEKKRRNKLYRLFDQIIETGGSCFFMGDLFDFYFEYPDLIPKSYFDFFEKTKVLKESGIALYFLAGNHDYWVGDHITNGIMDEVYLDDKKIEINGKKFFLTHGDGLLSWDHGYRFLKKVIRSKTFIWLFHWLHPTIGYRIAGMISRSGKKDTHGEDFNEDVRVELQKVAKEHFDNGYDFMISGHYHLGEMFLIEKGKLVVLGDWFHRPSYALFNGEDLELRNWEDDD